MRLLRSTLVALGVGVVLAVPAVAVADQDDIMVRPESVREGDVATIAIACRDYADAYVTSDAFGTVDLGGEPTVEVTVSAGPGRYRVRGTCGRDRGWLAGSAWLTVRPDRGEGRLGRHHHDHHGHHDDHDRRHEHGDERPGLFDRFRDHHHGGDGDGGLFDLLGRYGHDREFGHGGHDREFGHRPSEHGDGLFGMISRFGYDRHREGGGYFEGGRGDSLEDVEDEWGYEGPATGGGATAMRAVSPAASVGAGLAALGVVAGGVALVRRRLAARG